MDYESMRQYYSQLEDQLQSYVVRLQQLMLDKKQLEQDVRRLEREIETAKDK